MSGPTPNTERVFQLQQKLEQTWKPIKAVAPVAWSATALVLLVLAITIGIPLVIGTAGFHALQLWQMLLYYGLISAGVVTLAPSVVRRFRPGALVTIDARILSVAIGCMLAALVILLFPSLDATQFASGWRCLVTGTSSGAVGSVLFALVLRRGLAPNPVQAAALTGVLAGLSGIFVLAVQCPNLTAPHILTWHLTVLLVTGAAGAGIGWVLARVR